MGVIYVNIGVITIQNLRYYANITVILGKNVLKIDTSGLCN
jgi:hypothetical protein